jgi:hypothetical protein
VHPFVPATQLCTVPLTHCVAPAMHASVQHAAEPAAPEQLPLLHVCDVATYAQSFESSAHRSRVVALAQL